MAASNAVLEEFVRRTGWSRKEVARQVNQRARRRGMELHTDATRIRSWLMGQQPQAPVPELLSELFSEKFGYPVTPLDLGLTTSEHEIALRYSESITATVVAVADLGRYDVRRRGFLGQGAFLAAAAVAPSRDWLLAVLDTTGPRSFGRIGAAQVEVIRQTFAAFQEADVMRGGGYARHALAEYVGGRVLPMLHDVDPGSEVGAALFTAASEQTYLLGWMAFDDGRQALAQRYLIQALRLAQESGDTALGAHVVAGMSDQARMLGHPREALQLATTGRHGLTRADSPACSADLWALQARAHACLGDAASAAHAVVESERAFDAVDAAAEPEWARFIDEAYLCGEWANTFDDLQRPVEVTRFARRSVGAAARQNRARRGALSHAALARAAVNRREVERALGAAHRAVDLAVTVRSSRCLDAVRDLRSRFGPYRALSAVRDFDDHSREALSRASLN